MFRFIFLTSLLKKILKIYSNDLIKREKKNEKNFLLLNIISSYKKKNLNIKKKYI